MKIEFDKQFYSNDLPFLLVFLFLVLANLNTPFFWDTVTQASRWGNWFYEQKLSTLFLPAEIDAGHPPFFAYLLAICWTVFGKSLWVSHLMMLPFVLGIVWQIIRLIRYLFADIPHFWMLLFILSDATLLAQCTMVSPDIVLCFSGLLTLNACLNRSSKMFVLGTSLSVLVSIRGLFLILSFGLFILLNSILTQRDKNRNWKESLILILPSILIAGIYYTMHYVYTGWWISAPSEAWSEHRSLASFSGIIRNIGILGWRILDFGRVGIWLVLLLALIQLRFKIINTTSKVFPILLFSLVFILVHGGIFVLLNNPIGHRYLLLFFLLLSVLTLYYLQEGSWNKKLLKGILLFVFIFQLGGNLWIYPREIAQGWDASLAHLPFFDLRAKMINYIEEQGLDKNQIGTLFPNEAGSKYVDLSPINLKFASKDLENQSYFFYSTVMNDLADEEFEMLDNQWTVEKRFASFGIEVILYRKL